MILKRPSNLLIILFISYFSLSLARRALQNVYTMIPLSFKGSYANQRLGLIISAQTLGYTVTKLISGILMDYVNPTNIFLCSLYGAACSLCLMSLFSHWFIWLMLYTLNGLSLGAGWPAVAKLLRLSLDSKELATWWGIISSSTNVAGCVGSWITVGVISIASFILDDVAWRATFVFIGLCCILSALMIQLLEYWKVKLSNVNQFSNKDHILSHESDNKLNNQKLCETVKSERRNSTISKSNQTNLFKQISKLYETLSLKQRALLGKSATVHLCSTFLRFIISDWFAIMLSDYKQTYSQNTINLILSCYETGGVLGSLFIGIISDFVTFNHNLWINRRVPIILIQMGIASSTLMILSWLINYEPSLFILLPISLTMGLTVFGTISLCGVLAVEISPPSLSGTSHAFSAFSANVGAVLAGYPFALLAESFGWPGAFGVAGLLTSFSILPFLLL